MYTEEEQLVQLRHWWQRYGKLALVGIVMLVMIVSGWRYWQARQARVAQEASILFDHLLVSKDQGDDTALQGQGNYLLGSYSRSIYAQMGALILAKYAVDQSDLAAATEHLQWALEHGNDPSLRQLARLYLARIQLSEKDYGAAQTTLETIEIDNYAARVYALRGDIAVARNAIAQARDDYQHALAKMNRGSSLRQYYQVKLEQLPSDSDQATSMATKNG